MHTIPYGYILIVTAKPPKRPPLPEYHVLFRAKGHPSDPIIQRSKAYGCHLLPHALISHPQRLDLLWSIDSIEYRQLLVVVSMHQSKTQIKLGVTSPVLRSVTAETSRQRSLSGPGPNGIWSYPAHTISLRRAILAFPDVVTDLNVAPTFRSARNSPGNRRRV